MIFRHPQTRITAIAGIISALFVSPTFAAPTATATLKPTPKPTPRPTPKPTPKPVLKPAVAPTPKPTPKPAAATAAAATRPATNAPSTTPTASVPVTSAPTTSASAAASTNEVVATVNNEKILKSDIDRLVAAARASNKALQGDSEEAKKKLAEARREIITNRIDLILWMQEAARRNIVPAKGDVDKFVAQNKSVFRNNTEWVNFLNGRTEADYRKTIAQEMVITELFARLTAENNVTEEEIRAYYEANKSKFQVPEMVRVHHIFFILPKNADQTEKSRVTAQANEVLKKAQAPGANFEALAREYSQASDVMQDSGGLPLFWRGGTPLPKEFQDAAFGGRTGQIVGPVQTSRGLHIIKIDEKIPSGPAPLSVDIKRDIRLALKTKKNDELLNAFLADLNKKAVITRTG